jgi:hypothetical protein
MPGDKLLNRDVAVIDFHSSATINASRRDVSAPQITLGAPAVSHRH